jgi:hypothetical protein
MRGGNGVSGIFVTFILMIMINTSIIDHDALVITDSAAEASVGTSYGYKTLISHYNFIIISLFLI